MEEKFIIILAKGDVVAGWSSEGIMLNWQLQNYGRYSGCNVAEGA